MNKTFSLAEIFPSMHVFNASVRSPADDAEDEDARKSAAKIAALKFIAAPHRIPTANMSMTLQRPVNSLKLARAPARLAGRRLHAYIPAIFHMVIPEEAGPDPGPGPEGAWD